MADLKVMFEAMKFKQVETYIQSGNVCFKAPKQDATKLEAKVKAQILKSFGYEVNVCIRSIEELEETIQNNPYFKESVDVKVIAHTFLQEDPDPALVEAIQDFDGKGDEFQILGRTIYLFCSANGFGRTKLTNNFFERKLKVAATTRNWKTSIKMLEIAKGI